MKIQPITDDERAYLLGKASGLIPPAMSWQDWQIVQEYIAYRAMLQERYNEWFSKESEIYNRRCLERLRDDAK